MSGQQATSGRVLTGPFGTATEQFVTGGMPAQAATVAFWFLDCPGQSPAWRCYGLGVVHLRDDIPGAPPAKVNIPHATHEVLLIAYNPDRSPQVNRPDTWHHLAPINVCEQLELPSDEAARDLLHLCAKAVVDGFLPAEPPLSGAVEPWRTVLLKGAAHARGEAHSS